MDADVERALAGNFDFLGDVIAAGGESQAGARDGCSVSASAVSVRLF